ncbi:MAG: NAD(P)-dependent alcohol dehydrogenase [Steroidobacteraceae bacterium]
MQIRAAVLEKPHGQFKIETLEIDQPQPSEVLVRIVAAGICHTDLSVVEEHLPAPMPIVLGHEGAGIVERVGSAVTHVAPGDHVVLTFPYCGRCSKCKAGRPYFCEQIINLSLAGTRADGSHTIRAPNRSVCGCFFGQSSFATHAIAYANNTVKVPKEAPLEAMAPLGCGIQTGAGTVLNVLKPTAQSAIAVFGCGAVGLAAVMAAKLCGARVIVAVDRVDSRLDVARALGATHIVNTERQDALEVINAAGGLDFSVEASGNSKLCEIAVAGLKPFGGVCAMLGVPKPGSTLTFDHSHLVTGRSVVGITQGDAKPQEFIPQLAQLFLDGKLPVDKLVRTYRLDEINQAVADSVSGRTIKPVLQMA